jgi:hypothetical protein
MTRRRWSLVLPAVLVATGISVVACSDLGPTGPSSDPAPSPAFALISLDTGFVRCTRQAGAKAQAYIGSAGGTLKAGFGKITIGAGALSTTKLITLEAVSDTINSVRLSPDGLLFNPGKAVTLTIDTKNCLGNIGQFKKVVYTRDDLRVLSVLSSVYSSLTESVSSPLSHFSRYAVHH